MPEQLARTPLTWLIIVAIDQDDALIDLPYLVESTSYGSESCSKNTR